MNRREFLSTPLIPQVLASASPNAQVATRYDIVLKGGHVIDVANRINQPMDVAVQGGKIARIDRDIQRAEGKASVDVSGYYVTPGLIDLHICCYYSNLNVTASVIADHHCLPSGVTTCCDGGTAGADNFEDFKSIIDRSKMRILSFLNIAAPGAESSRAEQDPSQFKVKLAADTAKKYPNLIVGFKTGHYGGKFDQKRTPWASIDAVVEAGRLTGLPVLADFTPMPVQGNFPARSYREFLLEKMRPGDIVTHCLANRYPFLMDDGKLNPDVAKARARGVKFDLGHAGGSFTFRLVVPAVQQGFIPDSISADLFADTPVTVGIKLVQRDVEIPMPWSTAGGRHPQDNMEPCADDPPSRVGQPERRLDGRYRRLRDGEGELRLSRFGRRENHGRQEAPMRFDTVRGADRI
jgi:dihydroorotase